MGLAGQHQIVDAEAQHGTQNFKVLRDIFVGLIQLDGKVHTAERAGADTAEAGGEAMGRGNALGG